MIKLFVSAPLLCIFSCKKNDGFGPSNTTAYSDTTSPLKSAAAFPIGVAISYTPMVTDTRYSSTVKSDFSAVTFDYNMKHGALVKNDGTIDFTKADEMVNASSGLEIFGHALGWHQNQNATYLKNAAGLLQSLSSEMLANEGFESGLTNWSVFNTNGATISANSVAAEAHTGTGSMKVVNPTSQTGNQWKVQVASNLFPTTVGQQYVFSYWVKAASANGSIRLSSTDQNFANSQYQGDQSIGTSWQQVSWSITASSTQTRILFDMGQMANTYFIDDASLKQVLPPVSGAQTAVLLDQVLGTYITSVVNHFKGKVHSWDVINELFADDGTIRNNSNTSTSASDVFVWSNYMGRDYALKAFNYAKAADPTATLFINDYNLETSPAKLDSLLAFVKELKTKGAKVDGIGTQMHIGTSTPLSGIETMMQKLGASGLKIRISELDVRVGNGGSAGTPPKSDALANQAVMIKYVVGSYLRNIPAAQRAGITVWGLTDNTSWLYNSGADYPLLYDQNYKKKPAYASFLQALRGQ